jgi:hypothetical protein
LLPQGHQPPPRRSMYVDGPISFMRKRNLRRIRSSEQIGDTTYAANTGSQVRTAQMVLAYICVSQSRD